MARTGFHLACDLVWVHGQCDGTYVQHRPPGHVSGPHASLSMASLALQAAGSAASPATANWKLPLPRQSATGTTWTSWHRWTAISLLAAAFLAAAAAWQRARDGSTAALRLIPITVTELLRQLRGTVIPWPRRDKAHRDAWTHWRRRHQYHARQAHQRWHAYADKLPQP